MKQGVENERGSASVEQVALAALVALLLACRTPAAITR
jgi:Flp pilus assembly pilin Flp